VLDGLIFNSQFPSQLKSQTSQKPLKMSDINSTRLPVALAIVAVGPYIGGDANFTLTRGER